MPPDPVLYRLEPTGRTPHELAERLVTTSCPACGADWTARGAVTPRHSGGREYRCEGCGTHHRTQRVDEHGRPVATPGWNAKNGPGTPSE